MRIATPRYARDMDDRDSELREQALKRLKAKREFHSHLFTYVGVNVFLVLIWAISGFGFFWPVFPILGWAIFGLIPHAWNTYRNDEIDEASVQREMEKLR